MTAIGRYELVGRIAIGDHKELLLGREASGRPVAIKRVPPGAGRGTTARHPNLVEIHDLVQVDGEVYLVEEYLEGENLAGLVRRLIKRRERISFALAAHMIAEVCDGLHAAHQAGELHRAIAPETIFITYGGDVKLLDLGIAVADAESPYRSPEQVGQAPLGRQTDVYSAALVLYELTTLRRAFADGSPPADPVPPPSTQLPDYPAHLEAVCMRAIDPDPARRHRSAAELRDALLQTARQLGVEPDPGQALAAKLMRLFGDRIATKRELLDRVRVGLPLGDVVPAEVDEDVVVPVVARPERARAPTPPPPPAAIVVDGTAPEEAPEIAAPELDDHREAAPVAAPIAAPEPVRARVRWGVLVWFVLAIAGGGAAGWYLRTFGLPF